MSARVNLSGHVEHVLHLKNVEVKTTRVENLSPGEIEVAASRGFALFAKALLACNKIFSDQGLFLHLKADNWSREIADIPSQILSRWQPELVGQYSLPVSKAERVVVATPAAK